MKAEHYEDIGRYFRDIRESLKIPLAQAARDMHIRLHYLEALENGKLDGLPGKTYVRGYLKNYALYLGVDEQEALQAYDVLSPSVKRELYIPEPTVKENLPSQALMALAAVAAVLFLGYYLMFKTGGQARVNAVGEVPTQLVLEAEASRDPRISRWRDCLATRAVGCFNLLKAEDILADMQQDYQATFTLLSQADGVRMAHE